MAEPLEEWYAKFAESTGNTSLRRISNAAGRKGKEGAIEGARSRLGGDMVMSGIPRGRLTVNQKPVTPRQVMLLFGPNKGMWNLANTGRHRSGPIYPKPGGGRRRRRRIVGPVAGGWNTKGLVSGRAVLTPEGPRARSSFTPQRRKPMALDTAVKKGGFQARVAARQQMHSEIRRALGGPSTYRYVVR